MTKEELITFLKENLIVWVSTDTSYTGDWVDVRVTVQLGDENICTNSDGFSIPRGD